MEDRERSYGEIRERSSWRLDSDCFVDDLGELARWIGGRDGKMISLFVEDLPRGYGYYGHARVICEVWSDERRVHSEEKKNGVRKGARIDNDIKIRSLLGNRSGTRPGWAPKLGEKGSYANVVMLGEAGMGDTNIRSYPSLRKRRLNTSTYLMRIAMNSDPFDHCPKAVQKGGDDQVSMPVVKGVPIGNGWLYRSAVATFDEHHSANALFESFLSQVKGDVSTKLLGRKNILITFLSESGMKSFVDNHKNIRSYWFSSVVSWSVDLECNFEREVWISCYGIPVHAWSVGTFIIIGQHWGEVLRVEDDIANCVRCDVGKLRLELLVTRLSINK
ncbi:hypothetical protein Dimus_020489 [Dionaea muscipula]